ncbi:MAG: heavy metal-associated domain-containing protein [Bacteroidales bacterium]
MKKISLVLIVFAGLMFTMNPAEASKPKTESVKFWVSMNCLSCQQKIQENLSFEKGVKDMKFDLAAKTVDVTFDPQKTNPDKLKTFIEKLGYEVKVIKPGEEVQPTSTGTEKSDTTHKCSGQKDADHKCAGQKDAAHKCAGEKTTEHKCAGEKTTEHKCTGQKDADHKCCSGSKDPDHKCCKGEGEHKCTGHKTESGSTETKTHNCNHGKQ